MKLLVLSDTQLGSGQRLTDDRLGEQEAMLNGILDLADEEQVDVILHLGDVFQQRHPSEEARLVFRHFARRAYTSERRLMVCAGNHDLRNAELPSAVDLYDCEFFRRPHITEAGEVGIAFLPWTPPHLLRTTQNGADLNAAIAELLIETARGLREQCGAGPAVLALHWAISGSALPNGMAVEDLPEPVIPLDELVALGFDAVLGGHIHQSAVLQTDPLVLVAGTPWLNDWGEEGIEHGVWIIDPDALEDLPRFVPVPDRRFATLDFSGDEVDVALTGVDVGFLGTVIADASIRLRYTATEEQARRIDHGALTRALLKTGAHRVAKIESTILRADRARAEGLTEHVSDTDAFTRWLDVGGVPAGLHPLLRETHAEIVEEVGA